MAILDGILKLHYGIWKLILMLPFIPRTLCEMTLVIGVFLCLWPLSKYVFWVILVILHCFNKLFLGGIRNLCCLIACNHSKVYDWDDSIGKKGSKIEKRLDLKREWLKKSKRKDLLKKGFFWMVLAALYIWVCLPWLQMEKHINAYYLSPLYVGNKVIIMLESFLTKGIEDYPDLLIKQEDKEMETAAAWEETVQEPVYLMLREDVTYANVREKADLRSKEICSVAKKDSIVYQNVYEHDGKRYWLKVIISSQDDKEGWISEKVIAQEILEMLDLQ